LWPPNGYAAAFSGANPKENGITLPFKFTCICAVTGLLLPNAILEYEVKSNNRPRNV
jgi:hypothetical protein